MSYAQKKEISGNRTLAIIMVVVIQFALGYAIVTGLAYNIIKKASENLKTFEVEEQPPPPEKPPPPPKDMPKVPPPPMTPPPLVRMEAPPPPIQTVSPATPPPHSAGSRRHPAAAAAAAQGGIGARQGRCALAVQLGRLSGLRAVRGCGRLAQAQLTIGPDGRVVGCSWFVRRVMARSIPRPATSCAAGPSSLRPATAAAMRRPIRIRRRPSCGVSKANRPETEIDFRRKAKTCKQHPPQPPTHTA